MAAGRETDIPFEQATLTTFEGYVKKTKKKCNGCDTFHH